MEMHVDIQHRILPVRVDAYLRRTSQALEHGPIRWLAPRFVTASALGIGASLILPVLSSGDPSGLFDPSQTMYWARLLGPVVLAGVFTSLGYRRARRAVRNGPAYVIEKIKRDLAKITGPGWVRRTFRMGALMAVGVGVPVGLLVSLGLPLADMPNGSRPLGFLGFMAMTALWTLPAAFGIRWLQLKAHQRFLASPDSSSAA